MNARLQHCTNLVKDATNMSFYEFDEKRSMSAKGDHAVVIGGSMAGLCAARVLAITSRV